MQLSRHQSHEPPPGPRLTVQTTRGLRVGLRSMRVPIPIQENAAELGRAGSSEPGLLLGPSQPGQPTHCAAGMARACSGNIDMPTRWVRCKGGSRGDGDNICACLACNRCCNATQGRHSCAHCIDRLQQTRQWPVHSPS